MKFRDCKHVSELFFSYEWSRRISTEDMDIIIDRVMKTSAEFQPMFVAIPWHIGPTRNSDVPVVKFARTLEERGLNVLLHFPAQGLKKEEACSLLEELKLHGIKNILALKGDSRGNVSGPQDFRYAKDFVQFVRERFGSHFTICVAGYPSGHPSSLSRTEDLKYLKEKVDAGADFIITQIIFEASEFINFVKDCRNTGIHVPIIPGMLPIDQDINLFRKICKICHVAVPSTVNKVLETLEDQPDGLEKFGVQYTLDMIKSILSAGIHIPGIHFFSLSRPEKCLKVKSGLIGYDFT